MLQETLTGFSPLDASRFIQEIPVALFSATLDGKILMVNPCTAQMLGYDSPDEMMTKVKHTQDLWADPTKRKSLTESPKSLSITLEEWVICKNGSRKFVAMQARLLPNVDGEHGRIEGALFDLSERRSMEDELAQREERFRMISEQSLMGISILQDQRIVYANQALSNINGRSIQEMLNWETIPFKQLIHPDDFEFAVSQARKKQAGDQQVVAHYAYRLQLPDGSSRWIDQFSKTVTFDGRPADMVMQIDINELKLAEQALEAEHERLAVTLRSIADGVIATDNSGCIRTMSWVAEKLTGWTLDEAVGQPITQVFRTFQERTRHESGNPVERVLATGGIVDFENTAILLAKDGTEHRISKSGSPIRDSHGNTQGVVLVFRDTTEKERLIHAAQQAQKLESLGVLAGGIAHDFNNLLGGIFGYADLAHERTQDPRIKDYLHKVLNNIERARALTLQLLTFAKGGEPMRKVMELTPYLKETIDFALSGSSVNCQLECPATLPTCFIDPNQIGQVIDNLVINATQSMPQGGSLWVKAKVVKVGSRASVGLKPGDYIRIAFKDEGIGIAPENLPKIFDPFFTTKTQGTGLGLATCYSIMKRHEGSIEVDSKLGKGTTFTLWLPISSSGPVESKAPTKESPTSHGLIWFMDDDLTLRELASEILTQAGYTVTVFAEGRSLVESFKHVYGKAGQPVGIILDLTVPGQQGGVETSRQIRAIDKTIPLFVTSGYAEDPVMADPKAFGFSDGLKKPFFKSELLSQLQSKLSVPS